MPWSPAPEEVDLPVLLDFPRPHLRAYARETVIAEKFQAMVGLGLANSRMKDYLRHLDAESHVRVHCRSDGFGAGGDLARRGTEIPVGIPEGLSAAFAASPGKQEQWDGVRFEIWLSLPVARSRLRDIQTF